MNPALQDFFAAILRLSWQASIVALLVLAAQWGLKNQVSFRFRSALWSLVLLRLVIPSFPQTHWSIFNYATENLVRQDRLGMRFQTFVEQELEPAAPGLQTPAQVSPASLRPGNPTRPPSPENQGLANSDARRLPRLGLFSILAGVWLIGFAILAAKLAFRLGSFHVRLRCYPAVRNRETLQTLDRCAALLGSRKVPMIVETAAVKSPALCGLFKPRILVPSGTIETFTVAELESIFLHELVHLKRRDLWLAWLEAFLCAIHWFNPVLYFAFKRMDGDRELACDETVLSLFQTSSRKRYAETLLKLIDANNGQKVLRLVLGTSTNPNLIQRRIKMITQFQHRRKVTAVAVLLVFTITAIGLTDAKLKASSAAQSIDKGTAKPSTPSAAEALDLLKKLGASAYAEPPDDPNRVTGISFSSNRRISGEELKLLQAFPDLKFLSLAKLDISDEFLSQLADLRSLSGLDLSDNNITDTGTTNLSKLVKMRHLNLNHTKITDKGLSALAGLTNMFYLRLDGLKIADDGLRYLVNMRNLDHLWLGNTLITDEGLKHLSHLTGLKGLWLGGPGIRGKGLRYLSNCAKLDYLNVNGCKLEEDVFDHLKQIPNLTRIGINNTGLTDAALSRAAGMKRLTKLGMARNRFSDAGIAHISGLTNLTELYLNLSEVTDDGLKYLRNMTKLDFLTLGNTRITDEGLKTLASLSSLKRLELDGTLITDSGLPYLQKLANTLEILMLNNTRITDEGLEHLTPLHRLRTLSLDMSLATDRCVKYLARIRSLRKLSILDWNLTPEGMAELKAAAPELQIVRLEQAMRGF